MKQTDKPTTQRLDLTYLPAAYNHNHQEISKLATNKMCQLITHAKRTAWMHSVCSPMATNAHKHPHRHTHSLHTCDRTDLKRKASFNTFGFHVFMFVSLALVRGCVLCHSFIIVYLKCEFKQYIFVINLHLLTRILCMVLKITIQFFSSNVVHNVFWSQCCHC